MPTINSIYIKVYNQKSVYRPGDELKGEWTVNTGEAFSVKSVSISLNGAALTRWENSESRADDNKGYECITSQEKTVFPETNKSGDTVDYPAGRYVYKFSFKLPREKIPSTYEGKYGAIRYWLSFDIERPVLRMHIRRIKVITVLDDIDVNLPTYSKFVGRKTEKLVTKALGFGSQGMVTLHAQTDRGAYCPGEHIFVKYIAENKSDKDLGRIKVDLMQKVKFRASGEEKFKYLCLKSISGEELKKGAKLRSGDNKQGMTIPAVPPTTLERASHIVRVQYYVKVVIDIPKINGGDAMVLLPITIGTIPQGHKTVPEPETTGASNITVIDVSSIITYAQCTDGYEDGGKIYEDKLFPRFTYIPWCTYVPNFKPVTKKTTNTQTKTPGTPKNSPGDSKKTQTQQNVKPANQQPAPRVQSPAQPSAPPMYDTCSPPSYDEVLREMDKLPAQEPDEDVDHQETSADDETKDDQQKSTENTNQHSVVMVIRFADACLKQFREALQQNNAQLGKNGGKVIAVSPQVIVTKGSWPQRTSIAMLLFETFDNGSDWFKTFKKSCDSLAVEIRDCSLLKGSTEEFQNEKNLFNIYFVKREIDTTSAEYKSLIKKVTEVLKPVRMEHGGVLICAANVDRHLTEQVLSTDHVITITQWDSIKQKSDYVTFLKTNEGKYKDITVQMGKYYKNETIAVFQTEDTSYLLDETNDATS